MLDHRTIIRYWERRRLVFLLLLVPPAILGYLPPASISAGVGDPQVMSAEEVGLAFLASFLAANLCYTFIYAIEFLIMGTRIQGHYQHWRRWLFVLGALLGITAAWVTAQGIYYMEYGIDPVTGRIRP